MVCVFLSVVPPYDEPRGVLSVEKYKISIIPLFFGAHCKLNLIVNGRRFKILSPFALSIFK